jgi:hypothetical protein
VYFQQVHINQVIFGRFADYIRDLRGGPARKAAIRLRQQQTALDPSQHQHPEWYERLNTQNETYVQCMMPLWDHLNLMDVSEIGDLQKGCMAEPLQNGCMSEELQKEYMTEELRR